MKELYVTITGSKHYYGLAPFKVGQKIKCVKEPDNPYDAKAIAVIHSDGSKLGYIKAIDTDKVRMLLSDRLDNWPVVGDIINVGHYVCHIYVESNPLADHEDL